MYCENIKKNLSLINEETLDIESLAEGEIYLLRFQDVILTIYVKKYLKNV